MMWRLVLIITVIAIGFIFVSCDRISPSPTAITTTSTTTPPPVHDPTATIEVIPQLTPTEDVLRGTVTLWHALEEGEISVLLQVIEDFKFIHPEVQFDVLYIPFEDLLTRYELSASEDGGPSILIGPDRWAPLLYEEGLILDLTDLVDESWIESFNPPALDLSRYHQTLVSLPYRISGVVLYRNRDIIPAPAKTIDDLADLARNATTGDRIGGILERSFFYSGAHLLGLGGNLIDDEGLPAFNDDLGLEWIDLLISFEQIGPTEFSSDNDALLFMENRVGYLIDGTWKRGILAESIGYDNLVIDPWPEFGEGQLAGFVQSRNLYLNSRVTNEVSDLAWRFCQFFVSPKYQLQLSELDYVPVLINIEVEDRLTSQAMTALSYGRPYPTLPEMEFYLQVLDESLMSIFFGGEVPDSALNEAANKIRDILSQSND
ncbi:MAG: sugar ABC transporter substrate-binding protein [Anaerolineales bacterium]